MQTINIKLDDDLIEEKLLKISSEKNRSINDLVLDLLYNYFSEKNNDRILFYKKLDPEKHRFKPVFPELDDNIIPTNPV